MDPRELRDQARARVQADPALARWVARKAARIRARHSDSYPAVTWAEQLTDFETTEAADERRRDL